MSKTTALVGGVQGWALAVVENDGLQAAEVALEEALKALEPRTFVVTLLRKGLEKPEREGQPPNTQLAREQMGMVLEEFILEKNRHRDPSMKAWGKVFKAALESDKGKGGEEGKGGEVQRAADMRVYGVSAAQPPKYDGEAGKAAVWWRDALQFMEDRSIPNDQRLLLLRTALGGPAKRDFNELVLAMPGEEVSAVALRLVSIYDGHKKFDAIRGYLRLFQKPGENAMQFRGRYMFLMDLLAGYGVAYDTGTSLNHFISMLRASSDVQKAKVTSIDEATEQAMLSEKAVRVRKANSSDEEEKDDAPIPAQEAALWATKGGKKAKKDKKKKKRKQRVVSSSSSSDSSDDDNGRARGGRRSGLCYNFRNTGKCPFGKGCRFRHEREEEDADEKVLVAEGFGAHARENHAAEFEWGADVAW